MKKGLFTILALSISLASYADNFIVDGIEYSTTSDNTVSVTNGQSVSGDVIIPEEVENNRKYKVTSIAQDAFSGNCDMTSISIPNSVTSIGENAFGDCIGLTSVIIGSSVTSIGGLAFFDCPSLTSIIIPNSVTSIGENAFGDCIGLTSVIIGSSVTSIGGWCFSGCLNLSRIIVDENNAVYDSRENCNCIIETKLNTLIKGCNSSFIPNSVTSIGDGAFGECVGLTGISIPNSVTVVGQMAFAYCKELTEIDIPASISTIKDCAFIYCSSLQTIVSRASNPSSLSDNAFDEQVFANATLKVPYACTETYENADGWKKFVNIIEGEFQPEDPNPDDPQPEDPNPDDPQPEDPNPDDPQPEESPYSYSILSKENHTLEVYAKSVELCKGDLVIPETIEVEGENYTVVSISEGAFYGRYAITSVTIPNSVTTIGKSAFEGCTGLTRVALPSSITRIDYRTFRGCSGLTSVEIPNTVTYIGTRAFDGCTGLAGITIPNSCITIDGWAFDGCTGLSELFIPNSVTSIGQCAFRRCTGLSSIVVEEKNTVYDSRENCNSIIETKSNTLIQGCNASFIPSTVVCIGGSAFEGCTSLTGIDIPNSVTSIGGSAFSGCTGLKEVKILNPTSYTGLNTIDGSAFRDCSSLTSVTIPSWVTAIGEYAFFGCTSLESVYLNSENSFEIAENTFSPTTYQNAVLYIYGSTNISYMNYWNKFSHIEIPYERWNFEVVNEEEKTVGIGINREWYQSFWWNPDERPKMIDIPEALFLYGETYRVAHIVDHGFSDLEDVETITIPNTIVTLGDGAFSSCPELTNINIPENVTRIGGGVFDSCEKLSKVTLPESLTYLEENTFNNCQSLEEVHLPSKLEWIGNCAFGGCESLTKIDIPASVVSIGEEAFGSCKSLKEIILPSKLEKIEYGAFNLCESLTKMNIPASVISIGADAFRDCVNLKEIVLPNNLEEIGASAFSGCSSLSSINIPASVSVIGNSAFGNCESLININVSKDNTVYSDIDGVVYNKEQNIILIYPSGREGLFVIPGNVNVIGAYAFANCSKMSEVEIPLSVKEIEKAAFLWCTGLTSINIPNSVTTIGKYAFRFCTELTYIVIPSSVNEIGEQAFNMEGRGRIEKIVSLNINPPSLEVVNNYWGGVYEVFAGNTLDTATLFVPKAAMSKYQEADSWKNFKNITTLPILTGTVEGGGGTMAINGNTPVGQRFEIEAIPSEVVTVEFLPEKGYALNSVMCNGQEMIYEVQGDSLLLTVGDNDMDLKVTFTNNYLAIKDIETTQRKKFTLPIELQNAASITATQFDLVLPDGFILVQDKDGMDMIELTERTTQRRHSVTASTQEDGSIRIVCTSMSNATFADNSGAILNIHLQLTGRVEAGNYTIVLKNALLSDVSSESYTMPYTTCNVIVNEGKIIMGDVNNDEMINVGDIPALVSFIMGNARDTFVFKAADFNEDNNVRVDDYVSLVNLILGGANTRPYTANRLPHFVDDENKVSLQVDPISIKPGEKKYISVNLNNVGDRFTALQFDMVLPTGISIATEFGDYIVDLGSRTSSRKHDVSGMYQADGSFRVVCGSQSNAEFTGESGDIVKVMIEADASMADGFYPLEFKNITVARTDATSETCENIRTTITVGEPDGITIPYVDGDEGSWYSLEGKRSERKPMQQGIYVKDGKKLLIK